MSGQLLQMTYTSSATQPMNGRELLALLERARTSNQARGITGMLLYMDGNFIQVIEGESVVVRELHHRIARDLRHHGMVALMTRTVTNRAFPDWARGLKGVTDLTDAKRCDLEVLIAAAATPRVDIASHPIINTVIKTFVSNNCQ